MLINRQQLRHLNFDVELLGDCDVIINELCQKLGEGWTQFCSQNSSKEIGMEELLPPKVETCPVERRMEVSASQVSTNSVETIPDKLTGGDCESCSKDETEIIAESDHIVSSTGKSNNRVDYNETDGRSDKLINEASSSVTRDEGSRSPTGEKGQGQEKSEEDKKAESKPEMQQTLASRLPGLFVSQ